MAFEEGKEMLTCKACGAVHLAKWSRMPVREMQVIACMDCDGELYRGNSVRDYFEVNLAGR